MTYNVVLFAWRKPGLTPAQFKMYVEESHVPLLKSLLGPTFPQTHTRHYIERTASGADSTNESHPASVLVGAQPDFDYDAYSELKFDDVAAFQTFFGVVSQPDVAAKIAADEENFLDRPKLKIAVIGEIIVTSK